MSSGRRMGILVLEGSASSIATANWDGLVEKAVAELTGIPKLVVCVRAEDLRQPELTGQIITSMVARCWPSPTREPTGHFLSDATRKSTAGPPRPRIRL